MLKRLAAVLFAIGALLVALAPQSDAGIGARRLGAASQYVPTWSWNAATSSVVPAGATYTSASGRNCTNASGVLVLLSSNVPCFEHDSSGTALGYRSEPLSTNSIQQNTNLATTWTVANVTVAAGTAAGPDGTLSMGTLTEPVTGSSSHLVFQTFSASPALVSDTYYGISAVFKAGTRNKFQIKLTSADASQNFASMICDLSNGTVGQTLTGTGSGSIFATSILPLGGGLYRCGMIAKATATNFQVTFGLATLATGNSYNSAGSVIYAGDGVSYGYMGWAQLDSAAVGITSMIQTTSAASTRAGDVLAMPTTSVSGFNSAVGGVWVATYRINTSIPTGGNAQTIMQSDAGSSGDRVYMAASVGGAGLLRAQMVTGGTSQFSIGTAASPAPFARMKQSIGFGKAQGISSVNGALVGAASGAFTLPATPTTLRIGTFSANSLGGSVERLDYYAIDRSTAFATQVVH